MVISNSKLNSENIFITSGLENNTSQGDHHPDHHHNHHHDHHHHHHHHQHFHCRHHRDLFVLWFPSCSSSTGIVFPSFFLFLSFLLFSWLFSNFFKAIIKLKCLPIPFIESMAASLFEYNWLSWQIVSYSYWYCIRWQDPNNIADTEARCFVYPHEAE